MTSMARATKLQSFKVKITPLVIYGFRGGHTHTYFGGMKVISRNQSQNTLIEQSL